MWENLKDDPELTSPEVFFKPDGELQKHVYKYHKNFKQPVGKMIS